MIAPSDADFGDTLQIVLRYSGQSSVKRGKVQSEKTLGGGGGGGLCQTIRVISHHAEIGSGSSIVDISDYHYLRNAKISNHVSLQFFFSIPLTGYQGS